MNIAIIPARGGSKRIPRKNIKLFCGKPIIAWSIEVALKSKCFSHVIVSTDDKEISDVAGKYGAETPFLRPSELADDHTATVPVIEHATRWANEQYGSVDQACCIYATAPFLREEDLKCGLDKLMTNPDCNYAFSVTSYAFPIQRAIRINDKGRISMFQPEHLNTRSQDLEAAYHDAGQFYWGRASAWLKNKPLFSETSLPVTLPRHRVQDIDTQEDWEQAERLFRLLQEKTA